MHADEVDIDEDLRGVCCVHNSFYSGRIYDSGGHGQRNVPASLAVRILRIGWAIESLSPSNSGCCGSLRI